MKLHLNGALPAAFSRGSVRSAEFLSRALAGLALAAGASAAAAQCNQDFQPLLGPVPSISGEVAALEVFPVNGVPRLVIGGGFQDLGPESADLLAYWDGNRWRALGTSPALPAGASITDLEVGDLGQGLRLWISLRRDNGSAPLPLLFEFDGSQFLPLGPVAGSTPGFLVPGIHSLELATVAGTKRLFAGGAFDLPGSSVLGLGGWDGSAWASWNLPLLLVLSGPGALLEVGPGPGAPEGLYVGLGFGGVVRFDGSAFAVPDGSLQGSVQDLELFVDPSGHKRVYAAGQLNSPAGALLPYAGIASYAGSVWEPVAGPMSLAPGFPPRVQSISVENGPGGPIVTAGGQFNAWAGVLCRGLARFDGQSVEDLGDGLNPQVFLPSDMLPFDDGSGPGLVIAGTGELGEPGVVGVSRRDASGWRSFGRGLGYDPRLLLPWDRGNGPELLIAGVSEPSGLGALESWNGIQREFLPLPAGRKLSDLVLFDSGAGPELYGAFRGVPANVLRFTGSGWSLVGGNFNSEIEALAVYDAGSGPQLYATGSFTQVGAVAANRIARWNGSAWAPLSGPAGQGLSWTGTALTVFDSGAGPELIVAGEFGFAGGIAARQIAAWNGIQFRPLGAGLDGPVLTLEVHDEGGGPALYAAGDFLSADGISVSKLARWNGSAWAPVGSGIPGTGLVTDLQSGRDAAGAPRLVAVGTFSLASGSLANGLAAWNGQFWAPLGAGISGVKPPPVGGFVPKPFLRLAEVSLADLPSSLFVAGAFSGSGAGDPRLARFGCPGPGVVEPIAGCGGPAPSLTNDGPFLKLATQHRLTVTGGLGDGSGLLFAGSPAFDSGGCGLLLPGIGELLLSFDFGPLVLQAAPNLLGRVEFVLFMPLDPALVGIPFALQALQVNAQFDQLRLSTGLSAQIRP